MSIVGLKTKVKYTHKQETEMQALYEAVPANDFSAEAFAERDEIVLDLADKYHKTKRMIVAKLSKMDIYLVKPKVSKVTGVKAETKEAMVKRLEAMHNWPAGDYAGLEKAPKIVLQKLLNEFGSKTQT
jgi:hypothetical protein